MVLLHVAAVDALVQRLVAIRREVIEFTVRVHKTGVCFVGYMHPSRGLVCVQARDAISIGK